MPLIHKKTPAAFKKNIKAEIHAGKPQKQAVAIAYSVKREAEHKKHAHGGRIEDCAMCAEGGEIKEEKEMLPRPNGTLENYHETGKNKPVGKMQRKEDLKEFRKMPGPKIKGLAHGGSVTAGVVNGVKKAFGQQPAEADEPVDYDVRPNSKPDPHAETWTPPDPGPNAGRDFDEEKRQKELNGMAKGGKVEKELHKHESDDEEIHSMLAKELKEAMSGDDHKHLMDCLEACIEACMAKNKE